MQTIFWLRDEVKQGIPSPTSNAILGNSKGLKLLLPKSIPLFSPVETASIVT
jgi:hypothetical protein